MTANSIDAATYAKRGKARVSQGMFRFGIVPDWLEEKHPCFDWLENSTGRFLAR